jgi:hypothetical protein
MIHLACDGARVRTVGLAGGAQKDLVLPIVQERHRDLAHDLLRHMVEYARTAGRPLLAGETFAFGTSLLKFVGGEGDLLEVWENVRDAVEFAPGAGRALDAHAVQSEECRAPAAAFDPPAPHTRVVVSDGVFEDAPGLEGVRYPSPPHMSGWWLTTDRYDGNADSLRTEHLGHLTARRPDLVRYLALPFGYRFWGAPERHVRFDPEVAAAKE